MGPHPVGKPWLVPRFFFLGELRAERLNRDVFGCGVPRQTQQQLQGAALVTVGAQRFAILGEVILEEFWKP